MVRTIIALALLFYVFVYSDTSVPAPKPAPIPEPAPVIVVDEKFTTQEVPVKADNVSGDSLYAQVLNRHSKPFRSNDGRSTEAHETTHFINSDLRNAKVREGAGNDVNCFFIAPDKYFSIKGPHFRKREIAKYVPASLQFPRYKLYIAGQVEWDDRPLYVFDEWSAYIVGGQVGVEDNKNGLPKPDVVDIVEGSLEFSIYAVATCMATKDLEPDVWADKEFRGFVKFMLKRAEKTFQEGRVIFPFSRQDDILLKLRTSEDAEDIRNFIKEHFDGVFLGD